MNDLLVGILGLAVIAATVVSLTRSRMLPAMAFILWPSLLALAMVAGGRCSFADIDAMIRASALYVWSFSFLCLLFAMFIGLVPF